MSTPLVDPQLTAFFASDPSRQLEHPVAPVPPGHHHRELDLAIAAATLVGFKMVRDRLAARHESLDTAGAAARGEWGSHVPIWAQMIIPALLRVYELGHVAPGLQPEELQLVATSYVEALGEYIGDSSADALQAGVAQQINGGWDARLAWQRAAMGYGLDARDMRTYITRASAAARNRPEELISPVMRTFVDKAVLVRADLLGRSESWTAVETGKAIAWMYEQRAGTLPADAMREWDTAEDEATCAICAPFDRQQVSLQEPFVIAGRRLWAPQAHPGCRCHVKLALPELAELEKAWDPTQERQHPRGQPTNAGQFAVKVKPAGRPVAERVQVQPLITFAPPEETTEPQESAEQIADLLAPIQDLLAQADVLTPTDLLSSADLLNQEVLKAPDLLRAPDLLTPRLSGFATPAAANAAIRDAQRRINRLILVVPPRPEEPREKKHLLHVSVDELNQALNRHIGRQYSLGEVIDFAPAQHNLEHGTVRADQVDSWWAPDRDRMIVKRHMDPDPGRYDERVRLWEQATEKAQPLWNKAVGVRHERYVRKLSDMQLHHIMETAGSIGPEDKVNRDDMIDAINSQIRNLQEGMDDSLAEAYADFMTWEVPHYLGADGEAFESFLGDLHTSGFYFNTNPGEQVFTFDYYDSRYADKRNAAVVPYGEYQVVERTYKSGLHHWDGNPPPMMIGSSELLMAPGYVEDGKWTFGDKTMPEYIG